jgi:hypothetical protein
MDDPVHDADNAPELDLDSADEPIASQEKGWLAEIVDQLESYPEECRQAFETLETLEAELRLSITAELSALAGRPGAEMLLRLLSSAEDSATREAAVSALERIGGSTRELTEVLPAPAPWAEADGESGEAGDARWPGNPSRGEDFSVPAVSEPERPRLAGSLVTPVDGQGRGLIAVSISRGGERHTAAFLCDVRQGIRNVVGEAGPDSPRAGGLIDELDKQSDGDCARDVPELALGLLAGSLMLCGPTVPPAVRDWLSQTLGPGFQPAGLPATIPGLDVSSVHQAEMAARAAAVLDACPSWLDSSPLTFELAEEIWLREGRTSAEPERDRGAYRFLFEHRLIHCLELYQRMLLWMAWLWKFVDEIELARSAFALAAQLLDEQYAVPSHPFTVELTTRSLTAAQRGLRTSLDPRTDDRS